MINRSLIIAAMFVVQASACFSAVLSEPWTVNIKQHGHYSWTWKQGESVDMQLALLDGFKPLNLTGATVKFYWYTNATDNIWWEQPVTITVASSGKLSLTWLPLMDVGARQYAYWFGVWPAGGSTPVWRVTGTINILPSPGFAPNTLALPLRYLDFNALDYTNAPWATPAQITTATNTISQGFASDLQTTSNALATTIAPLASRTLADVAVSGPFAGTETITVQGVQASWFGAPPVNLIDVYTNSCISMGYIGIRDVTGSANVGIGYTAINHVTGDFNFGFGFNALNNIIGNNNYGFGYFATDTAENTSSYSFGNRAFYKSRNTNSLSIGINNAVNATGSNKLYMDVYPYGTYSSQQYLAEENALYLDNGLLNLGRTGKQTNSLPNRLRGSWQLDDGTLLDTLGTVTTNDLAAAIAAIPTFPTNVISGWVLQDLGTNLQYFVTSSNLSFKVWEVK